MNYWDIKVTFIINIKSVTLSNAKLKIKNIDFTGNVNPEKYYKESKILCLTSTYEGFGMVMIEAQQYGCVPIAYDSFESLGDIIDDGVNGFKISPFKNKKYTEKMELLINDENLRKKMSLNAMESCKKFYAKVIAQEWMKLFNKI